MKYVVFLCDGMADVKLENFGNKTPLEAANTPNMDQYAKKAILGTLKTVPDHLSPGSDVCNLSVMGYDSNLYYTGRSPLEAASIGVTLADNETSFRANLVTLSGEGEYEDLIMEDYSAGEIKTADAKRLIEDLTSVLNDEKTKIYAGVSYRHLLVLSDKKVEGKLIPPHDISKRSIKEYLPKDTEILSLMKKSYEFLKNHPYNLERIKQGKKPASSIWVWGEGKRPKMDSFYDKFGVKGSVISAVDLIKGIGILTGMRSIEVENVTGNIDTNFDGKAKACIDALKEGDDFVYVHMEAPDECGHRFEADNKKLAIELIDEKVIGPVCRYLEGCGEDFAILVAPDHPTPIATGTHDRAPVPFFAYYSKKEAEGNLYNEDNAKETGFHIENGYELMGKFLKLDLWK
ncbi:MAG: cofactor-independent phosphoglycerate mutase [Ruminococcaceae bacterium]|nr:cofactor-independent phosphoglycerate mutase [Oscillospiraceae bacterium]